MKSGTSRKVISRRTRPAKAALSRDVIVSTALDILAADGFPALSLRRIALALDTGPASLYVYVANLEELHALILDQALAAVELPKPDSRPWRDRLKALLLSYLSVLYERRGIAQIALSTIATGPNSLRIWEHLLALLKEGNVEKVKAAWGLDLLTLYVTAIAAEQSNRREIGPGFGRVKNALFSVTEDKFPVLFDFKEVLLSGMGEARRDWALDVMIDGLVGGRIPDSTE